MILFNILLQLTAVAVTTAVIFEDCGSAYELDEVSIEGCGMRLPCHVTLGENVPVKVTFYADFSSTKLDQDVVININLINLRANVTPEPCKTVHCPVRTNSATSFTSVMTVPTNIAVGAPAQDLPFHPDKPYQDGLIEPEHMRRLPDFAPQNQRGYLRWRVYNETGRMVLCYAVLVQIESPLQKIIRLAMGGAYPDVSGPGSLIKLNNGNTKLHR